MPMDRSRLLKALDGAYMRGETNAVNRILETGVCEARANQDMETELLLVNEWLGHIRSTGEKALALPLAERSTDIITLLGLASSAEAGTTWLNCATTLDNLGMQEKAELYYRSAFTAYRACLPDEDYRFAAYYNNFGQFLLRKGENRRAKAAFSEAVRRLLNAAPANPELAVTYLNMTAAEDPNHKAEIRRLLDLALDCLLAPGIPPTKEYLFCLEKCEGGFLRHGRVGDAALIREKADGLMAILCERA